MKRNGLDELTEYCYTCNEVNKITCTIETNEKLLEALNEKIKQYEYYEDDELAEKTCEEYNALCLENLQLKIKKNRLEKKVLEFEYDSLTKE